MDDWELIRLSQDLENEGLYNGGKLLRAAAESLRRRGAAALQPGGSLAERLARVRDGLGAAGLPQELVEALDRVGRAVGRDELLTLEETPAAAVCRTCGRLFLAPFPPTCPDCGAHEATFRRQAPIYFLELAPPEAVLELLGSMPGDLARLLEGVSDAQGEARPEPGQWNLRQAVEHLLDAQGLLQARVELMLGGGDPELAAVAAWTWVGKDEAGETLSAQLATFGRARRETVTRLGGLRPGAWWRTGRHPEFGPQTVLSQAGYFARHERSHWAQIARLRAAVAPDGEASARQT